jgi:D-alanyl-D-alanine carboxypeptidase (penicillin-binding protein 5/6)
MSQKRRNRRIAAGVAVLAALGIALGIFLAVLMDGAGRQAPVQNPISSPTAVITASGAPASSVPQPPTATRTPASVPTQTPESVAANARYTGSMEALSAILVDGDGGVLYDKQADERRYPASTTKILTALLALESGSLDEKVRVGAEADIPPADASRAGLRYGENLTVRQLLNALLIPSGNDAAYVLAAYVGRRAAGDPGMDAAEAVEKFVGMMNAWARELGASHSHFVNPDGYQDGDHYTTARDMALIARKAMEFDEFRKIVSTKQYKLPDVTGKDEKGNPKKITRLFANTNDLLKEGNPWYVESCTGIKTGHTSDAGFCLVSSAKRNGAEIIAVVMGSGEESVWRDSAALLQWGISFG